MTPPPIQGLHHITAFAGDPQRNVDFYTQVLGQRLVKLTVNFDDPGTYHLYYGDYAGQPGTILTFFPWPMARRGVRGTGEIAAVAYTIPHSALNFWRERLTAHQIPLGEETRFGQPLLAFSNPDGMMLELVGQEADVDTAATTPPPTSDIPTAHALRGFHSVTLWVRTAEPTAALLTNSFGYQLLGEENGRRRYTGTGNLGQLVDVVARPELGRGSMGAGSIHHIAFRTADDTEQLAWQTTLTQQGYGVTSVRDRQYFNSIYFREPSGALFEIATDPPGFTADEPLENLGQELKLPYWLEPNRAHIMQILPPLDAQRGGGAEAQRGN